MAAVPTQERTSVFTDPTRDAYRRFHARRHRMLIDLLAAHITTPIPRALDIGAGGDSGGVDEAIQTRFTQTLYSLDLGEDVALARAKGIQSHECNIDEEDFPFEDSFFDLVIFASVIEHLYNPHRALAEIARVVRPGGLVLVEAPNAVAFGRRFKALAGVNPFATFNRYNALMNKAFMINCSVFFTAEEVEEALSSDFDIVERRYAMHDPVAGPLKRALRTVLASLAPRGSDCFAVLARRRPS